MPNNSTIKTVSAICAAGILVIGGLSSLVDADVLLIQTIQEAPANSPEGIPRPGRGMSMAEVEQIYGPPNSKHAAVGNPPISRWEYEQYSVFFESDYVLHSVVRRPPKP